MSKSKNTQKKAAQGKAKPTARGKSTKAPAKKPASKPAPQKKGKPVPATKKPLPKPVKKAVAPKKPVKKAAAARPKSAPAKPAPKKAAPAAKAKKSGAVAAKKPAAPAKKIPSKKTAPKAAPPPAKKPKPAAPASKKARSLAPAPKPASKKPGPKALPVPQPVKTAKAATKKAAAAVAVPSAKSTPAPKPAPPAAPEPAVVSVEVVVEPPPAPAPAPAALKVPGLPLPPAGPTKSGALFYDSHMHTPLCKHAWGEPEEYAQQAIKAGLKGIIFTCHCPMPDGFWPTVRMADSEFDTYVGLVQRAAEAYKGKLDIRLGIESEYFPGQEEWITKLHQRADFHFVLGGVHWQAKEYLAKFETGTIENFRRTYFEHLARSAESGLYDCLAHPDLVKNYHPDSWCFAIVKNTVATALDRIAATGVAMELNTSGLNKSYSEMNPGQEMLRMMAERKIPVVVTSDAHRPVRVGEHFVTALNNLAEVGYEHVSYFLERKRIDLKIPAVLASLKKAVDANA